MREIKFRAWDNIDNKMYSWKDLLRESMDCPEWLLDILQGEHPYDVMQYTGLKDKNGVEIYEGDIVKVYNYLNGKEWEGHIHNCEIEFITGKFELKNHWLHESLSSNTIEVIGNIYENKDLLK